jgi:c-di-GMP-binding flagellar brake protein YcgR
MMEKIHLEAGLPILIELSGRLSFDTNVIGFESGSYIIVKLAGDNGDSGITVNSSCSARLLHEGVIYTFNTEVLAAMTSPAPLIFLKYPARIESVQLRRDRRYRVNLPAVLQDNTQNFLIKVSSVTDISMQGCRVSIPEGSRYPLLSIGDMCKVSFIVMYKYFEAACIVKNIYDGGNVTFVGIEFIEIRDICKELLNGMINILEVQGDNDTESHAA